MTEDSFQPGPEVDTGNDTILVTLAQDIANMDESQAVPPTSVEDEDTGGDIVNELDVLAEVKLLSRARKFSFNCFCNASNSVTPHDFSLRTKVDLE